MSVQKKYEAIGGQFFSNEKKLEKKLKKIKAYIFDWDGVFNDGTKANELGSPFSEPDSMGVNMLRFSHWLKYGELPFVFIITGAKNMTAVNFAKREHFHGIFLNYKNKKTAIEAIEKKYEIKPENMAFIFDDIIDLDTAKMCRLTFCIKRNANPLFNEYVAKNNLCDYMSGNSGGNHAVREVSELLIGLNGNYEETISKRVEYLGEYQAYLKERNEIELKIKK